MTRKRADFGSVGEAKLKALMHRGLSSREVAARLRAAGVQVSDRTVARRMVEAGGVGPRRAAALAGEPPPLPPPPALEPAPEPALEPVPARVDGALTPAERQVDALLGRAPVWLRIQAAIVGALAPFPDAAAAVVRALREVSL